MDRENPLHIKITGISLLLILSLYAAGCSALPQVNIETATAQSASPQAITHTAAVVPTATIAPSASSLPATQTPIPAVQLPGEDEVVLTITNPQPFSGREGDLRPDWLGWGAESFAVAADGSFWLADTAVSPNRLLHYSPQGELLKQVSLENIVVYASSLVIARDSLWVLDNVSQQPRVIQFGLDGGLQSSIYLDTTGTRFYYSLLTCSRDDLLVSGSDGYTELVNASGETTKKALQKLSCFGHTYQIGSGQKAPLVIDGISTDLPPNILASGPFLGFNPDGSFVLSGYSVSAQGEPDWQQALVMYSDLGGNLTGITRQKPMNIYKEWNHQLSFGPDGSVYQLLSNPDHSIQIVRLGFDANLPPQVIAPTETPVVLSPLIPDKLGSTGEDQARFSLLSFFSALSSGDYTEAEKFFTGDTSGVQATRAPSETLDDYWQNICMTPTCLAIAQITDVIQNSDSEYTFYAVFVKADGTRFELGACCGGDPAASPPIWQFAYPVQKVDGVWKVMRGPVYMP